MTDPRTFEQRLTDAVRAMVAALEPEERAELEALSQHYDPPDTGWRLTWNALGWWEVSWCGRPLGAIRREWLAAAP